MNTLRKILNSNHLSQALTVAALALFAAHASFYWDSWVDQAYVAFRYAENFALGAGLVYNLDERVEGFSSLLWTLWMSVGLKLHFDPLDFAKYTGGALGAATVLYLGLRVHGFAAFCLAASGSFVFSCFNGLEKSLPALFLVVACGELFRRPALAAIFFGLLPLAANWGFYFIFFLFLPIIAFKRKTFSKNQLILLLAIALLPFVALLAWRWMYYKSLVPNTFFAEVALPRQEGFWHQFNDLGGAYVVEFWRANFALLVAWVGAFGFVVWKRDCAMTGFFAAVSLFQIVFMLVGGDKLALHQLYAPVIPVLLATLAALSERIPSLAIRSVALALATILVASNFFYQSVARHIGDGTEHTARKNNMLKHALGAQLRANEIEFDTVFLAEPGILGYESQQRIIDGSAALNPYLAKRPVIHPWKIDMQYLLEQNPEWVVIRYNIAKFDKANFDEMMTSVAAQPQEIRFSGDYWKKVYSTAVTAFEQQILGNTEFHARFTTASVIPTYDEHTHLAIFCRLDVCATERLAQFRAWTPNLGPIKAQMDTNDAEEHLKRNIEMSPFDEIARFALARRENDRKEMRSIASGWKFRRDVRIQAYTVLGNDEFEWHEFYAALRDFKAAASIGGNDAFHFSNVGYVLKTMGRDTEARSWLSRAEERQKSSAVRLAP